MGGVFNGKVKVAVVLEVKGVKLFRENAASRVAILASSPMIYGFTL